MPFEVYKVFWPELGPILKAAVDDVFRHGPACASWTAGVVLPIYKGKGLPRDRLSSYRPITLLNTDNKLAQRAIAERMQAPLDFVVDEVQSAFIQGRWIGDNVLSHQGLAEHLQQAGLPGAVLVLDIKHSSLPQPRPHGQRWQCAAAPGRALAGLAFHPRAAGRVQPGPLGGRAVAGPGGLSARPLAGGRGAGAAGRGGAGGGRRLLGVGRPHAGAHCRGLACGAV